MVGFFFTLTTSYVMWILLREQGILQITAFEAEANGNYFRELLSPMELPSVKLGYPLKHAQMEDKQTMKMPKCFNVSKISLRFKLSYYTTVFTISGCKFCVCFSGDSIQDISSPQPNPTPPSQNKTPFLSYYMLWHFYKLIVESTF